jgi:uncharacterized SAM-binding protein YcdF (DUF218 family)
MSLSWLITNALASLLLPPMSLVLLGLIGWILQRRYRKLGITLVVLSVLLLVGLSTSAGSRLLVKPLEDRYVPVPNLEDSGAQAIVVLGGGRDILSPEDADRDRPSNETLMRLRHGARLQRQTGLPLLVSGGNPEGRGESEAVVMARSLDEDFRIKTRWIEDSSDNTAQNAHHSAVMLKEAGVQRVLLVTDAIHMRRAEQIFLRTGFEVVPAPTAFKKRAPLTPASYIPTAAALKDSHYALHEWIGIAWYRLRYGLLD